MNLLGFLVAMFMVYFCDFDILSLWGVWRMLSITSIISSPEQSVVRVFGI